MEAQHLHAKPHAEGEWSTGFCDCFSDCKNCCITFWCPCITFGQVAEIVDRGSTSCGTAGALYALIAVVTGCACIYSCFYRGKMRAQYNIKGDDCTDCLKHFCCELCSLTQQYRELKHRGYDMSLGWAGNVERQQNQGGSISSLGSAISKPTSSSSSYTYLGSSSRIFGLVTSSLLWTKSKSHHTNTKLKKQKLCVRNSAQEIPKTLEEDSKFVPLDPQDPRFGPPVLLLLGLQLHEAQKIQELLKELDGEFMEIVFCTDDMIKRSLWEAVTTKQPDLKRVKIAESLPRICFLSGLTGEEMMMFIDAFPETGLEPVVFAAMVPNSADKPIFELTEEIMGDHELLTGSSSS